MANRKAKNVEPNRGDPDEYDRDLDRDNRRQVEGLTEVEPRGGTERKMLGQEQPTYERPPEEHSQKDRKGQAQSPVELNLDQPPKRKEGHG